MKLRQNAKELVLLEVDGLGLILGEIRYNKQTETAIFALEKAAFFDLYVPCAVIYDPQKGPVVRPHVLSALTTGSIRVQRSKVSCFILGNELSPSIVAQYQAILQGLGVIQEGSKESLKDDDPKKGPGSVGPRVITLPKKRS
ncbi:hypothetical protein DBT_0263 [Dissulfuribacter thermophilus]|uniref:Uncharacterized protein n=1 Tax=Dissulfuribacter thermophilus TaxID=1156395 RepID=A0A1B9F948_9BACT|nr:hypothetical protein [Dissulfuribacter thermophilus]OCC16446.1 hypothetical protein DBT_0263 [Dissulfuribacter thermophilus]